MLDEALKGNTEAKENLGKLHINPEDLEKLKSLGGNSGAKNSKEIKILLLAATLKIAYRHMLHDRKH